MTEDKEMKKDNTPTILMTEDKEMKTKMTEDKDKYTNNSDD